MLKHEKMRKRKKCVFRRPIRIFEYLDMINAPPKLYADIGRLVMHDLTKNEKGKMQEVDKNGR